MFRPTQEQQHAIELFRTRDNLRIDAYAGSGKTTTLHLLASSTMRSGYYLSFGKANQLEAGRKFPPHVACKTTSALAYGAVAKARGYSNQKMTQAANSKLIAEVLGLPKYRQFPSLPGFSLSSPTYAWILREACKEFLFTTDEEPNVKHFPRYKNGVLILLGNEEFRQFASEALPHLKALWNDMQDPRGRIPLGYDGFVKLWALSHPQIQTDFILLDEAQDSNPVVLEVLENQPCQIVYVGDPYQQIYEWRGAVNAMARVATKQRATLTQSFRFGQAIAAAASKVIAELGAQEAIRGREDIQSDVCLVKPGTILCRTNFGVITHLIAYQLQRARCHIIGGTEELTRLLHDVSRLKQGIPPQAPEFFGFSNWDQIVDHSNRPEGVHLKSFVRQVIEYGETRLLQALEQVERTELNSDIILSTAHKAKGREWPLVYLDDDFEGILTTSSDSPTAAKNIEPQNMRLLYVAMTRAINAVEMPPKLLTFFEFNNSRSDRVGASAFLPPRRQKNSGIGPMVAQDAAQGAQATSS